MLRLSPTAILTYDECPRKYYYRYIERLENEVTSANLPFGGAVHAAFETYLKGRLTGQGDDPVDAFQRRFDREIKNRPLEFKSLTMEEMEAMGQAIAKAVPKAWDETGFTPLISERGDMLVEQWMETTLVPGVRIGARIDVAAMTPDAENVLVDLKTAKSPMPEDLPRASDQLAVGQLLLTENAPAHGLRPPAKVGFMEAIKRKVPVPKMKKDGTPAKVQGIAPTIEAPNLVPAYGADQMDEYKEKWTAIAADIQAQRFPKRTLQGHNSPCSMCDFAALCLRGDPTGLKKKPDRRSNRQIKLV
jgi:RecB family exonuclease